MQKNEQKNEKMKSKNKQKKKLSLSNAKKIAFTFSYHRCFEFLVSLL
jgi:cobyrinic acid a,c-diamide synthase